MTIKDVIDVFTPHLPTLGIVLYFGYKIVMELQHIRERITKLETQFKDFRWQLHREGGTNAPTA